MERYIYYIRDNFKCAPGENTAGRPMITVCLLAYEKKNGLMDFARGVSVCSHGNRRQKMDMSEKADGRRRAVERAVNALVGKKCSEPFSMGNKRLRHFDEDQRQDIRMITRHLSVFDPILTAFETRLKYGVGHKLQIGEVK